MSLPPPSTNTVVSKNLPDSLQFLGVEKALPSRRYTIRLNPINGSTFGPGQTIRFDIPNQYGFFDGSRAYLSFTGAATGGTAPAFENGISTVLQQMRVQYGSLELENIQDYGTLIQVLTNSYASANFQSTLGIYSGYNSLANRQTNAPGFRYCVPAFSGFSQNGFPSISNMIPLCIAGDVLRYEFTLDQAANALYNTAGTSTYSLTDVVMVIECVAVDSAWQARFVEEFKTRPLSIHYETYNTYTNSIAAGSTAASLTIADKSSFVDGIFSVMRNQADITNQTVDGKYETFNFNSLTQFQMQVNGALVPDQPVNTTNGSEGVFELMKMYAWPINSANLQGDVLPTAAWATNKCILCSPLEAYPYEDFMITGSNQAGATGQMILTVKFGAALSVVQQVNSYVMHDRVVIYEYGKPLSLIK